MKYLELAVIAAFIVVDELRNGILMLLWSLDVFTLGILLFIVYYFREADWTAGLDSLAFGLVKKTAK